MISDKIGSNSSIVITGIIVLVVDKIPIVIVNIMIKVMDIIIIRIPITIAVIIIIDIIGMDVVAIIHIIFVIIIDNKSPPSPLRVIESSSDENYNMGSLRIPNEFLCTQDDNSSPTDEE